MVGGGSLSLAILAYGSVLSRPSLDRDDATLTAVPRQTARAEPQDLPSGLNLAAWAKPPHPPRAHERRVNACDKSDL